MSNETKSAPTTKPASVADAIRAAISLMHADLRRHQASAIEYKGSHPDTALAAERAALDRLACLDELHAALPRIEAMDLLADAAPDVLKGFADGIWVRDVAGDTRSDWAVQLMRPIAALARFEAAVAGLKRSAS